MLHAQHQPVSGILTLHARRVMERLYPDVAIDAVLSCVVFVMLLQDKYLVRKAVYSFIVAVTGVAVG